MTPATPYRLFLATFGFFTLAAGDVWRYLDLRAAAGL